MMKKILFFCMLLFTSIIYSQEFKQQEIKEIDVNPFRIGIKIGTPNAFGAGIEYVTPLIDNRIALFFDYSFIAVKNLAKFNYLEFGTNIYLKNTGRGLYGSLSYGKLDFEEDPAEENIDDSYEPVEINTSTFNVKIGAKLGKKFYFRIEAGYGFGSISKEIVELTSTIPGFSERGYPIANLGFGFSF